MTSLQLWLNVLGTNFEVTFDSSQAEVYQLAKAAWSRCEVAQCVDAVVVNVGEDATHSPAELLEDLTVKLTNFGLDFSNAGKNVLIHAAAVADENGLVTAFIGASGAGKTTLVSTLAKHYGYVTDETLAVDLADRRVTAYPKPLSLIRGPGAKTQVSPDHLDLKVAPAELRLGALYLLNRSPEHVGAPQTVGLGWIETLELLVPQISYLGKRQSPLLDLMRVVGFAGGIKVLKYKEAADLVEFLAAPVPTQAVAESGSAAGPGSLAGLESVQLAAPLASAGEYKLSDDVVTAIRPTDAIRVDNRAVILANGTITVLEEFAADLWIESANPSHIDDLVLKLLAIYPAEDMTNDDAKLAVIAVARQLEALGLMECGALPN